MKMTKTLTIEPSFLERRYVAIFLNGILFVTNFLLFYFIWLYVFADITGLLRLVFCWAGAYSLTWIMSLMAKGAARLALVVVFLGILYIILMQKP